MNILICGGRDFNNETVLVDSLNELQEMGVLPAKETDWKIVSGMARGADKLAYEIAKANDIKVIEKPADWNTYGKQAGFVRNIEMLDISDVVIAFWDGQSKGTHHTIANALYRKMLVIVYDYNGQRIQ